jgi:hypothetical protein
MMLRIPEGPGDYLDSEAAAIRATASASSLVAPLIDRINWLLAARGGHVFSQSWPASFSALAGGRIYHRPSPNCGQILVVALIESSPAGAGYISIDPSDGAGTAIRLDVDDTTATTRWGDPGWFVWIEVADLTKSGLQYHTLDWSDLYVRHLSVFEVGRSQLDTSVDTCVSPRSSSFAGLEIGKMITEGTEAGIRDITAAIASVQTCCHRHFGFMFPTGSAWSTTSSGSWADLMDAVLSTSGGGMKHRAPMLRSDDTVQDYDVRIWAKDSGTADGDVRVSSVSAGDSVSFTALTNAYGWHSPDSGTLDIDCTADDTIIIEVQTDNWSSYSHVASVQLIGCTI